MAYIERAYLTEQFENLLHDDNMMCPIMKVLDALEIIDTAPSADVEEVVRCKDCNKAKRIDNLGNYRCFIYQNTFSGNHYCSYGKKKQ